MDHIQAQAAIPQLVQVQYQSMETDSKIHNAQIIHISHPAMPKASTYQQTITSKSLQIPVSHMSDIQSQPIHMSQAGLVLSCPQTHLQNLHHPLQSQMTQPVLQSSDLGQPLHVILPQVSILKQQLVGDIQPPFYRHYDNEKQCIIAKVEPDLQVPPEIPIEYNPESKNEVDTDDPTTKKRNRNIKPDPESWACNVRKLKHQKGEAYVSRRGKFVPERKVRTVKDCLQSCKYKCGLRINETDREHIFKAFYSLNANEKKHFLLNTTERNEVNKHKTQHDNFRRKHSFRYFFLVRAVRYTVCKNFYLGTLAISQKPVYNVHLGKSEMNIPKPDGRGLSEASAHSLPSEVKDTVRKHIMSFTTENSKPVKQFSRKKQYLDLNLSVKQMYIMYSTACDKDNVVPVKESMYRKIFKQEFNLHFRKVKTEQQLCCKCKSVIKKK